MKGAAPHEKMRSGRMCKLLDECENILVRRLRLSAGMQTVFRLKTAGQYGTDDGKKDWESEKIVSYF